MNKTLIFLGMLVAVGLLFEFGSGKVATDDIFTRIVDNVGIEEVGGDSLGGAQTVKADGYFNLFNYDKGYYERVFATVKNSVPYVSDVTAMLLPASFYEAENIAEAFVRLKATQKVDNFIIIGENHSRRGRYEISCSRYGYKTPYGELEPNIDIIDKLELPFSYWSFWNEYSVGIFSAFIKRTFPEAKIVPIVIKDFEAENGLADLAETLAAIPPEKTVLIVSSDFAKGITYRTAEFHDELSRDVMENFDGSGISQMDVDSRPGMSVLFKYLELFDGKKADIQSHDVSDGNSYFVTTFHDGNAVSSDRDLSIMAFGDIMLGRYVRVLMDQYGKDYIFEKIKGDEGRFFDGADVVFGNLEGPIDGQGTKGGTSMVFSFNEDVAPFLKNSGFTLVSIANNHSLDQGAAGRDSTIAALDKNGIGWCGNPSNADPSGVYYGKAGDKTYAFLCFQDVTNKLDDEAAVSLIKSVRPNVDFLIVSIHWGY
ncbi:MAG: AmmeMemoRadiSam system protein B, partial [Candidatus Peregrinibacteria bacterium]